MGTTLTGTTPQDTYDSLIKVTDNGPLSGTAKYLSDGLGNDSTLALSTTAVGIGTASPAGRLSVEATGNHLTVRASTAAAGKYWALDVTAANQLYIINNAGTQYLTITDAGNVGIGTTNPQALVPDGGGFVARALQVSGSGSAGFRLTDTSVTNGHFDFSSDNGVCEIGAYYSTAQTININAYGSINFKRQNTTIATITSSGLTFNGDTAAANALDDYEEGTWTMGLSFGGGTTGITYSVRGGTYTKIGRQVTVNGLIALSSKGSSTGTALLTGLPFTIANTTANYGGASLYLYNISFANQYQGHGTIGATTVDLREVTEAGVVSNLTDADFQNNSEIIISLTYFV